MYKMIYLNTINHMINRNIVTDCICLYVFEFGILTMDCNKIVFIIKKTTLEAIIEAQHHTIQNEYITLWIWLTQLSRGWWNGLDYAWHWWAASVCVTRYIVSRVKVRLLRAVPVYFFIKIINSNLNKQIQELTLAIVLLRYTL